MAPAYRSTGYGYHYYHIDTVSTNHNHLTEQLRDVYAVSHTGNDPLQGMEVLLWVLLDLRTLKQASLSVKKYLNQPERVVTYLDLPQFSYISSVTLSHCRIRVNSMLQIHFLTHYCFASGWGPRGFRILVDTPYSTQKCTDHWGRGLFRTDPTKWLRGSSLWSSRIHRTIGKS